jgi:poly(A) polymerase
VHLETEANVAPAPLRRLAAMGAAAAVAALRLSRAEARQLKRLQSAASGAAGPGELAYRYDGATARDAVLLRSAAIGEHLPESLEDAIARGAAARFPLRADDLPDLSGRALGRRLAALEAAWIASDFTLSKDALLKLPAPD